MKWRKPQKIKQKILRQMKTNIYVLKDARAGVRYVGKTSHSPAKRFSRHICDARDGLPGHKACWIRSMMRAGKLPTIETIDVVSGDGCLEEIKWIVFFRNSGIDLTNATDGGEGTVGRKASAEARHKQSKGIKRFYLTHKRYNCGLPASLETRLNMSLARKGKRFSDEHKKKISEAKKGKAFSDEHKANLSESHSGSKHRNYGKHLTDELKKKISESVKKTWPDRKS